MPPRPKPTKKRIWRNVPQDPILAKNVGADQRRVAVAEMYLKGLSQREIADEVGVSQKTVCQDIQTLRQQWLDSSLQDFDKRESEELARLDNLEAEAWAAFARSCEGTETVKSGSEKELRGKKAKKGEDPEPPKMVEVRRKTDNTLTSSAGDPAWLNLVFRCIEARLRILGSFAKEREDGDRPTVIVLRVGDKEDSEQQARQSILVDITDPELKGDTKDEGRE